MLLLSRAALILGITHHCAIFLILVTIALKLSLFDGLTVTERPKDSRDLELSGLAPEIFEFTPRDVGTRIFDSRRRLLRTRKDDFVWRAFGRVGRGR